jgi:tagatose 1,6-diphosphate aldolase
LTNTSTTATTLDLGKLRGMQRIVAPNGMINACALDVLDYLVNLLNSRGRPSDHAAISGIKRDLITALAPHASAVLLDAQYGLQSVAAGALPASTGLIVTIEDEDYDTVSPTAGRRTIFRDGWSVEQIKLAGADVAKLLWFYRPDRDEETAEHQRNVLAQVAAECDAVSIPLVVEPIWYPYPDEDATTPEWRNRRIDGIVESALKSAELGADLVKAEFPGYLDSPAGVATATAACEEIGQELSVPWITLSGGVPFATFAEQVAVSCRAGASGFLAGRAVWQDTVDATTPIELATALDRAAQKVDELCAITAAEGRPATPWLPFDEVVEEMPGTWYLDWHNNA